MRISDWSSDVCSSDLEVVAHRGLEHRLGAAVGKARRMAAVGAHRHRGEAQEAEQDPEQTHGRQYRRVASESSPAGLSRDPALPPDFLPRLRGETLEVAGETTGFGGWGRRGSGDDPQVDGNAPTKASRQRER